MKWKKHYYKFFFMMDFLLLNFHLVKWKRKSLPKKPNEFLRWNEWVALFAHFMDTFWYKKGKRTHWQMAMCNQRKSCGEICWNFRPTRHYKQKRQTNKETTVLQSAFWSAFGTCLVFIYTTLKSSKDKRLDIRTWIVASQTCMLAILETCEKKW